MTANHQRLLSLPLLSEPASLLDDGMPRCGVCKIPLNIPGDRLSTNFGGDCLYCITKEVDDALESQLMLSLYEEALA